MLKIGCIGFGGGNALIPVMEQELVKDKKLITEAQLNKDIVSATLTPGALPVELASGAGKQCCKNRGMIVAAVCMTLPGAFLTCLVLNIMGRLGEDILKQIQYASLGVVAFIMFLLSKYIVSTLKTYKNSKKKIYIWSLMIVVFLLTCGKNLFGMLGISAKPPICMTTVDALLLAFFAILYTNCKFNKKNTFITFLLSAIFIAFTGNPYLSSFSIIFILLRVILIAFAIYGIIKSGKSNKKNTKNKKKKNKNKAFNSNRLLKDILIWVLFLIILSAPAIIFFFSDSISFILKGILSSLMSFGGGDSYLTIADGLFVPYFLSDQQFYSQLAIVVNVLPGSILCKTLTGVGYIYGEHLSGSVYGGICMALSGFAISISASCSIFFFFFHIYSLLETVKVFALVKKSIKVIVSGLLLTVMLGLLKATSIAAVDTSHSLITVLIIVFTIYGVNMYAYYKKIEKTGIRIVSSIAASMIVLNIIDFLHL